MNRCYSLQFRRLHWRHNFQYQYVKVRLQQTDSQRQMVRPKDSKMPKETMIY